MMGSSGSQCLPLSSLLMPSWATPNSLLGERERTDMPARWETKTTNQEWPLPLKCSPVLRLAVVAPTSQQVQRASTDSKAER